MEPIVEKKNAASAARSAGPPTGSADVKGCLSVTPIADEGESTEEDLNIYPNQADPLLDPIESPTSMVYNMTQRELARRPPNRVHGPLPEQSSFVASAGAAIPQPRVTTEMSTARLTRATTTLDIGQTSQPSARSRRRARGAAVGGGRARGVAVVAGRTRGVGAGAGAVRARGAGAGPVNPTGSRGRGAFSSGTTTGRGRGAYCLLFGDDSSIPDLNAVPEDMVHPTI
ncbi:hypothetical protein ZWY2020_019092 [Hordeum vulgare]|nr:hypothetical protein ZWY2020_019092 [Hordeum vulgare]